jgi:hypothetical protein
MCVKIGFVFLKMEISDGLLWNGNELLCSVKILGITWVTEHLVVSQERLSSMESEMSSEDEIRWQTDLFQPSVSRTRDRKIKRR